MRRKKAQTRKLEKDPIYGNTIITKLINCLMYDGKKMIAERIVYDALEAAEKKVGQSAQEVFSQALENVKPMLEVKSRRVGGATYQVPIEVRSERQIALALRWLIDGARARSGRSMGEKLANEFVDAFNNTGAAVRKREEMHRMAEGNRAFANLRW